MAGEDTRKEAWATVGPDLLRSDLTECRYEIETALRDIEEELEREAAGDPSQLTPEHVQALRRALNELQDRVENQVAPLAGDEPWGDPPPRIPTGVLWELSGRPKAEEDCNERREHHEGRRGRR